jgi:phosphoribosylformylglycinamidine synthase
MWQFVRGVEGIRDAAFAFNTPVISGNVSFYNETEGHAIPPTPTIAIVGVLEDVTRRVTQFFNRPGDRILLVRTSRSSLAASEYEDLFGASGEARLEPIDLAREKSLIEALVATTGEGLISSAHDVSEGGLAVTLAEACFNSKSVLGAEVDQDSGELGNADLLFGEGPSSVILSAAVENVERVRDIFGRHGIECVTIGIVTERGRLKIGSAINEDVSELWQIYEQALPKRLERS